MNTYKLKFTRLQNEIFRLFCIKAGSSLNQRGIAKSLKVSPSAVGKALLLLEKEGLIKIEKGKNINLNHIEMNRDNYKTIFFKKLENLKIIYELGLINFLEESFPGTTIILFGSFSRGEDTIKSDIDISIIGAKEKDINLEEFNKILERKINVNFYDSLKNIDKYLRNNILNGIILVGVIDI